MTRARSRARAAGFTLVELMVSLTGGLFISLAVFALARDSGRFYQREARIANATVSGLLGFERLRNDIARAGFMASPNAVRDFRLCGSPLSTWPLNMRNLASIQVTTPAVVRPALATNGRTPPSLLLAGSYASADSFFVTIEPDGTNTVFRMDVVPKQAALMRLGAGVLPDTPTMASVFPALRVLRIVQNGRQYYGQIVNAVGGASPTVTVNATPPIQFRGTAECGLASAIGSGASKTTINVVNFIQYELRTPVTPTGQASYATVYQNSDGGPGESGRTELMRVEQDLTGAVIDGTEEIVAEYAVDFNLQLSVVTSVVGCCNPTIGSVTPGDALFSTFTGPTFGTSNTPELIRSVRVRLGVRSREGDRAATVASPADAGLYRFNLGTGNQDAFARVRTFQADIALHNQLDVLW